MSEEELFPEKRIELHHHSIDEIMGAPPARIVAVGSGIILILILGLFVGSFFISYPIIIQERAVIQGEIPLTTLTSLESGKIINIYSFSNNIIYQGDTVIQIEKLRTKEIIPIIADVDGIIDFNPLIRIKQVVQPNDTIGHIWDKTPLAGICIIDLSREQMKQVQTGNKIRLHFDAYPSEKFGTVDTYIQSISTFNTKNQPQIITMLDDSLITSNQYTITVRGNLYASVEIITEEQSLFNRLINPFRGLMKK
ncbi:MAG: efflux RND transporter periplasmic adaptor subunit [Dysgonamonadaceae bacterium]|jgi:hypothetical protein|nr:efflux RND transporter periplasmic adaptor subunit [Dysgonamonadaceae bacterium]